MLIANVLIQYGTYHLDQTYSYISLDSTIKRGMRVLVPFNNRNIVGIVLNVETLDLSIEDYIEIYGFQPLEIKDVLDETALLNEELLNLGVFMQKTTISPLINCYSAMLPSKLKPSKSSQKAKTETMLNTLNHHEELTDKQAQAYSYIKEHEPLKKSDFVKHFNAYMFNALNKKGVLEVYEAEVRYKHEELETVESLTLSQDQQKVYDEILNTNELVYLLHGVTGSGKTEVYLQLAEEYIKHNKEVLILVPEISLTPQMIKSVKSRFGDTVAIYHSHLNDQERYEQYQRVNEKKVKLTVGTRSSIFMPFDNIGLIIMDEEHDKSYKQGSSPRYHARDIAIERAKFHNAKLVLGSATPSLESYAKAHRGHYKLLEMPHKIGKHQKIEYQIIDTQKALYAGGSNILTNNLLKAIDDRLSKNEQVVILLNRRGYAPVFTCKSCYEVKMCKNCEISMSYHRDDHELVCHMCGLIEKLPVTCDHCGSQKFDSTGFGTQRVESELYKYFPYSHVVRMDSDQVSKKGSHEKLLNEFEHKGDILLGTQMIAKGLDYHRVTLVAVLNADAMLARNSYRATEDTFNLINQVSGRGGRGDLASELLVQSFDAKHYAIVLACEDEYVRFFNMEMKFRHLANYPPYSHFIKIILSAVSEEVLAEKTIILKQLLHEKDFDTLGPSDLIRINKYHRKQFILRSKNLEHMINEYTEVHQKILKKLGPVKILVDVNPMEIE